MKLRNKKTGEIVEPFGITCANGRTFIQFDDDEGTFKFETHSLAELNEEWEDYEEPKEEKLPKGYWVIEPYGKVEYIKLDKHWSEELYYQFKNFGNCFETEEEAEKAVKKLKAYKRLKDKGFRFKGINMNDGSIKTGLSKGVPFNDCEEFYDDMTLLFGGEENGK